MLMRFKPYKVTPDAVRGRMNILIYGNQGVGKTRLAATAQDHPDMADVLFGNIEGGMITIASRGDILAVDIASTQDLEDLFWALKKKEPPFDTVRTFVIDSGTELQTLNLEEIVRADIESEKNQRKAEDRRRTDLDFIYQEDYGKSTTQLKRIFRWFRDLDVNIIVTALPKRVYPKGRGNNSNEDVEPIEVRPSLTDKLSDSLMGYMDFVWYMFLKEEEEEVNGEKQRVVNRYLLTRDHGIYRAKTRGEKFSQALGLVVKNPTLPQIYDIFLKSETVQ